MYGKRIENGNQVNMWLAFSNEAEEKLPESSGKE